MFRRIQPLTNTLAVFAGKGDGLGGFDQCVLASGNGTQQFVNQAFIANPAFLLAVPYTSFTTGATNVTEWGHTSLFIFDAQDRTRDFFRVGDLFSRGVIVGGEVQLNTNLFGLPGEQHVGAVWKHVNLNDLRFDEPPPGQFPYPTEPGFPTKSDSYTICYGFDQYLVQYADQPVRGWDLFGRASISDGNPTPLRSFLSAGSGGDSPLRCNRGDTWGIGWYFAGASNQFGPLPRTMFNPQDGTGVEMFYNFQVTPWLNVTPDIQFVRPEARAISADAFIYGLRVNMTL